MKIRLAAVALPLTLLLVTACSSDNQPATDTASSTVTSETPASSQTPTPAETTATKPTPAPTETEAPKSEIEAAVDTFVSALDELDIEHSEPVRAEVGASGAKARFDLTINGFSAGINIFPDVEALAAWGEMSDAFGGIYVASGNAALSLNSSDGIANSSEIAPLIADAVGGEAHGV